jgi:cytoskeletal protein CcmA (bactofilin family)
MALQSPFFGKREPETPITRSPGSTGNTGTLQRNGTASAPASAPQTSPPAAANGQALAVPAAQAHGTELVVPERREGSSASKLTVGPHIRLKGVEITDCDTLFVEGMVEATMDSRVMEIAEPGSFKGSAEIDVAEIHGQFEGTLTVRQRLVIHPTGRVSGTVRYGKITIAEGGQISGDIGLLGAAGPKAVAVNALPGPTQG